MAGGLKNTGSGQLVQSSQPDRPNSPGLYRRIVSNRPTKTACSLKKHRFGQPENIVARRLLPAAGDAGARQLDIRQVLPLRGREGFCTRDSRRFSCSSPMRGTQGSPERRTARGQPRADFAGYGCRRQLRGNMRFALPKSQRCGREGSAFPAPQAAARAGKVSNRRAGQHRHRKAR
jgi:hypothetical protein